MLTLRDDRPARKRLETGGPDGVGLESFTATCGKASLGGAVNGKPRPIRLTVGGKEPAQGPADPAFLDFKAVGRDGNPSKELPLEDGYFEMRLPKAFFEGNPKALEL